MNRHLASSGFTLLEVLISMAIMVFIAFAIYQATTQTYKLRDILSVEGDFYNSIRLCTDIMDRDISSLYSPTIMIPLKAPDNTQQTPQNQQNPADPQNLQNPPAPQNQPNSQNAQNLLDPSDKELQEIYMTDDLGRSYTYWTRAIRKNGIRPSHFIGTEDKLSFISLSHIRIYQESPESDFAKVSYEISRDTKATDGTSVLIKTESSNAFVSDDFKDPFKHSFELLHGIKKLNYTYYRRDGNTWKTSRNWDSDKEETRNIYPDIIEMKIEVVGPKNQIFEGIYKFRPEIPLNGINPIF